MPITVGSYFRDMLILVKMENRGIRRKTLETKERSITGTHLTVVIRAVINKRPCAKVLPGSVIHKRLSGNAHLTLIICLQLIILCIIDEQDMVLSI